VHVQVHERVGHAEAPPRVVYWILALGRRPVAAACDPATLNPATDNPEQAHRGPTESPHMCRLLGCRSPAASRRPRARSYGRTRRTGCCRRRQR
jgi:hypothetical protein